MRANFTFYALHENGLCVNCLPVNKLLGILLVSKVGMKKTPTPYKGMGGIREVDYLFIMSSKLYFCD